MPRPPTHRHVLRDLRKTIQPSLSQAEMAKRVGVSTVTINRIENGTLDLSKSLATRIMLATGMNAAELLRGKNGKLRDAFGGPYTADTIKLWREKKPDEQWATQDARNLQWWIEILLRAAAREKGGTRYHGVRETIKNALSSTLEEFGLKTRVDAILREFEPRVPWGPLRPTSDDMRDIQKKWDDAEKRGVSEAVQTRTVSGAWLLAQRAAAARKAGSSPKKT